MDKTNLEMLVIITNRGIGEKVTEAINDLAHFPSIIRSNGTAPNEILSALGLGEPEKDMIFCFLEKKNIKFVYDTLKCNFGFGSGGKGIAFTIPVSAVGGNVTLQILLGKTRNVL